MKDTDEMNFVIEDTYETKSESEWIKWARLIQKEETREIFVSISFLRSFLMLSQLKRSTDN